MTVRASYSSRHEENFQISSIIRVSSKLAINPSSKTRPHLQCCYPTLQRHKCYGSVLGGATNRDVDGDLFGRRHWFLGKFNPIFSQLNPLLTQLQSHSSFTRPKHAPGRNAPLIRFLILALYIFSACLYRMLTHVSFFHFFLTYLLSYLYFPLRTDLLRFQAGCRKRTLNLAFVFFVCILFSSAFLLIGECTLLLC